MNCRNCSKELEKPFLDLGFAPPSNDYLTSNQLKSSEVTYPLKIHACQNCWLVQTEDYTSSEELFKDDYAYFSSTSKSWLKHAEDYCNFITPFLSLNKNSSIVEIASNDGYLLKNFIKKNIPCLGIEPTTNTAEAAELLGIKVIKDFFSHKLAIELSKKEKKADLIIGNNVYAHVPDINDFTLGMCELLKKDGTITLEFPHLMQLMKYTQFDTIYHEHFSYLSLIAVKNIFLKSKLRIYNVEEIKTHGGSLRIFGCHQESNIKTQDCVNNVINKEINFGLDQIETYYGLKKKVNLIKNNFLSFLIEKKNLGKKVVAYGAAAKGCTLVNYSGLKSDLIEYVCDAAKSKQNKYMPGSHIPILNPEQILIDKPDFIIILPWNLSEEISNQLSYVKEWNASFVTAIPELKIF